jgi:hypothetical protein
MEVQTRLSFISLIQRDSGITTDGEPCLILIISSKTQYDGQTIPPDPVHCIAVRFHPSHRQIWLIRLCSLITSSNNGYDGSIVNGLQSLPQWRDYFNHPSDSQLGLLSAIQVAPLFTIILTRHSHSSQSIGTLATYPITPYLADGLGRKPTLLIGCFFMCVATAIQAAAQSVEMFIGARLVTSYP